MLLFARDTCLACQLLHYGSVFKGGRHLFFYLMKRHSSFCMTNEKIPINEVLMSSRAKKFSAYPKNESILNLTYSTYFNYGIAARMFLHIPK